MLEVVKEQGREVVVVCTVCREDPELFGAATYTMNRHKFVAGQVPCGCSSSPRMTEAQNMVITRRHAETLGHIFIGWYGEFVSRRDTYLHLVCPHHGPWTTSTLQNYIRRGYTQCPVCHHEHRPERKDMPAQKTESQHIEEFFASGVFHPATSFTKLEAKAPSGRRIYWEVVCGQCTDTYRGDVSSLKRGCRGCACMSDQCMSYIHWIGNVAIKFGITTQGVKSRLYQQQVLTSHTLRQHSVYAYPTVQACKAAERECKRELVCGILTKEELPDGYTETTYCYNIAAIEAIYRKHGGERIS